MSRIWKALKQAEKERLRSKEPKHSGHSPADPFAHPHADKREHSLAHSQAHPHSDGADRRRSERWEQPVPVMVYGSDSGKPFHEQTETADINDDGCSFTIATTVAKGQRLFLVNMLTRFLASTEKLILVFCPEVTPHYSRDKRAPSRIY